MENLKTISKNIEIEIVEKKSKFIAHLFYVESEDEAEKLIKNIKKKYYDARHNCYAYRVIKKYHNNKILFVNRSSDDGEPSGTAGGPMLNILEKKELVNVLVIVTRYFGGILLGTGGLVKAYSEVTMKALEESNIKTISYGYEVEVKLEYKDIEKFKYFCRKNNINIVTEEYLENVILKLEMKEEMFNNLEKIVNDKYEKLNINIKYIKKIDEKYI